MTSIIKEVEGKNSSFPSSIKGRVALQFPIFMGLFGVLSRSDPTQEEREREREQTEEGTGAFSLNPLFLDYLLIPILVSLSLSPLFSCLYLLASLQGGPLCQLVLSSSSSLPFLYLLSGFLWLSFGSRKMMKKKIRVSKDPSSSSTPYFPGGLEARARFKHDCLLQDYQDLLKETKEKRERLEKILQKKSQLLAEVKFLRRKFQQFSTTQKAQLKLKKQSRRVPSTSVCLAQPKNPVFQAEIPLKSRSQKVKEIPIPTSTPLLDLNQVFLPTSEEMEGFEVERKPQNVEWFKRFSREGGDVLSNDSKLSICRDSRIGSNKAVKRKVSWQDQVALRV